MEIQNTELSNTLSYPEKGFLINHIESDLHLKAEQRLIDYLLRELGKSGFSQILFIEDLRIPALGVERIRFNPDPERLLSLGNSTKLDYILSCRIGIGNPAPGGQSDPGKLVEFSVYDLQTGGRIYYSKISFSHSKSSEQGNFLPRDIRKIKKALRKHVRLMTG